MKNLMKMSDAERKATAMKMASDVRSNPGLMSGNNNAGTNSMMQKMRVIKIVTTAYLNYYLLQAPEQLLMAVTFLLYRSVAAAIRF
jgi:hypothetical protein